MPFRLCHECRSLRESLRNNFVLCRSVMFKSRACFVRENLEVAVLWSALNHGCSYCKYDISVSISFCIHGEKTLKCIKISISSCRETDEICITFFSHSGCWIKYFFFLSEKNFLAVRSDVKTKIHCILGCIQHLCIYVKTNSKFPLCVWGDCFTLCETSIKMFDTGMQMDR